VLISRTTASVTCGGGSLPVAEAFSAPLIHALTAGQGPEVAIHHSDEVLDGMNAWSCEHHGASGLTARCRASSVSMQVCGLYLTPAAGSSSPRTATRRTCSSLQYLCTGLMSTLVQEAEVRVLDFVQRYTDDTTRHHLAGLALAFL
jgi:hypothetical protein